MISSRDDLHAIFDEIRVRHLMEPLASFSASEIAEQPSSLWESGSYDVVGVAEGKVIRGYWRRGDIGPTPFRADDLLADSASITDALEALAGRESFFVLTKNRVDAIVTRSDLYKTPFRLFCYGLVTLLEARMTQLVERHYGETWAQHLSDGRLKGCQRVHAEREMRNEQTRLFDCLQFADKRDLIVREDALREAMGRPTTTRCKSSLKEAEKLRNRLAHGHRLDEGCSWSEVIEVVRDVEGMLLALERKVDVGDAQENQSTSGRGK